MLTTGCEGVYEWLVTDEDFDLFLQISPDVVLGKHVAITSIDSGELVPTKEEMVSGWQSRGKIAYSPKVENVEALPRAGWAEWYIFDHPADLGTSYLAGNIFEVPHEQGHLGVFVNYGFALHPPRAKGLVDMFWQQLAWVSPESYVADNDFLTFVTRDKALFGRVHDAFRKLT